MKTDYSAFELLMKRFGNALRQIHTPLDDIREYQAGYFQRQKKKLGLDQPGIKHRQRFNAKMGRYIYNFSEVIYPDGQKKYKVTTMRLARPAGLVSEFFFDHGDEIKLFDNVVDALDYYAKKLDDNYKWNPPRRKRKSRISEIRRIVREAGMLEDQLQDDILEELELGQGTVHIDQLLDMFRTKYPGVPIEDFHDIMQILERSQVISLEGSSGFYHLNRPYLDEGTTVKITRRQIRRIIQEVNRRPERIEEEAAKIMSKVFDDFLRNYPQFGRAARRRRKGRPSFVNDVKAEFYLKIPGEKRNLTFDIQVYSVPADPSSPKSRQNSVDVVLDFEYGGHQLFDNYTFVLDEVIGSQGQLVLDKIEQYAESILSAHGPVPLSEAKNSIDLQEYVSQAIPLIRKEFSELAQIAAEKDNVTQARHGPTPTPGHLARGGHDPSANYLRIQFAYGLQGNYVKATIVTDVSDRTGMYVKLEWEALDQSADGFKRLKVNATSLKLSDWVQPDVTDPEYMVEDYVKHVRERIDELIMRLSRPR